MATYLLDNFESEYKLKELNMYGSSRLGVLNADTVIFDYTTHTPSNIQSPWVGKKMYELTNHLGNVLATVTDKKVLYDNNDNLADWSVPEISSASDYYPFGMQMPGRNYQADGYRFGFNGKENDNDVKGVGNSLDFGARIYDSRVSRFISIDKYSSKAPDKNPYCFVGNMPNIAVDPEGNEIYFVNSNGDFIKATSTLISTKTGAELYAKYARSKSVDIYIGVSNFGPNAEAGALTSSNANNKLSNTGVRVNGNNRLSMDADVSDESKRAFSVFNKTDFSKSKGRVINLVVISDETLTKHDKFEVAETIFHEIKAHIDINTGDPDIDHQIYGKTTVGLYYQLPLKDALGNPQIDENNNAKIEVVPKNSPAYKIVTELKANQAKESTNAKKK